MLAGRNRQLVKAREVAAAKKLSLDALVTIALAQSLSRLIPEAYLELARVTTVTPDEVEEQFVKANPGLPRDAIAVTCDNRRLQEVRICMSKELGLRSCPEVDRRGVCRRDQVVMPPVRGGR